MLGRKPKIGYQDKKKIKKTKKKSYISSLFVNPKKHTSINEKVVKFLIYIALRLVIRPKKWKHPRKNYEIIDRTYKRIMSADFIFIPSSVAFYIIMAFMPILSLISFLYMIPGFQEALSSLTPNGSSKDALADVIGRFVPGAKEIFQNIDDFSKNASLGQSITGYFTIATSLIITSWIAAGGFSKLVFTQSYIYEHKFVGGYWMNKIKGMIMVFSFTIFLIIGLTINIVITSWIESWKLQTFWNNFLTHLWLIIALGIGIFIGMILLFKFSPRYKIKVKNILPGAMVTTIPTLGFLALFSAISSFWSYGNYGAIGTIMYIGMAALIISYFIFVGLIANAAYYKTFVGDKVKTKWTLSRK